MLALSSAPAVAGPMSWAQVAVRLPSGSVYQFPLLIVPLLKMSLFLCYLLFIHAYSVNIGLGLELVGLPQTNKQHRQHRKIEFFGCI